MLRLSGSLLLAFLIACSHAAPSAPTTPPAAAPVDARVTFWREIRARDGPPPEGADVPKLALELATPLLRSPDPSLRDGVATDVLEFWIRRDARLDPAALRTLTA